MSEKRTTARAFQVGSFAEAARFVAAIAEVAEVVGHFPDVDVRPEGVTVRTASGEYGALSHAHLDNVLWRDSGEAVLLDWAGATIGPPAVDAARFVVESPPTVASDEGRVAALVEAYQAQLRADGGPESEAGLVPRMIELAARPLADRAAPLGPRRRRGLLGGATPRCGIVERVSSTSARD